MKLDYSPEEDIKKLEEINEKLSAHLRLFDSLTTKEKIDLFKSHVESLEVVARLKTYFSLNDLIRHVD